MPLAFSHPKPSKPYKFIAIVITLCLFSGCVSRAETNVTAPKDSQAAIRASLDESDRLFSQRSDIENLRKAVRIVSALRTPDDRNFEVEWKYAKYCFFLGKVETDQDKAGELFEKGRAAGAIAARLQSDRPDGHFWFGANLGELARISPLTVGLKSVDDIRSSMEKVIAIEPGYQGASAFDALGQLEMATRLFKGGKTEKAVEYYEKGIALSPDNSNIRLHLAEAYLVLKRDAEARKQIDTILSMKPNPEFVGEHQAVVEKAKELLSKNF